MGSWQWRALRALGGAVAVLVLVPAVALAHPLGNFTINHYAGIGVSPDRVALDVVIDSAEIPTVMARQRIDANGDGTVSDQEIEAERQVACLRLAPALDLTVAGTRLPLTVEAAGLSFPPGAAGLETMRLVCEYGARLPTPLVVPTAIRFSDGSYAGQIGWREVVALGDGTTVSSDGVPTMSVSNRLTHYPQELLAVPLDLRDVTFTALAGGVALPPACVPDASSLSTPPGAANIGFGCAAVAAAEPASAVPGGVGGEIAGLLRTQDLTLPVIVLSLLTALLLGAGHALTPGHGKTIMAAYLVGTRGTGRHALMLALTVTVSHTLGVLALAAVILFLNVVTPESFNRATGILSALIVLGIGTWLAWRQALPVFRGWLAAAPSRSVLVPAHAGGPRFTSLRAAGLQPAHAHDLRAGSSDGDGRAHSHGGASHTHELPSDTPLTWRSLFALGLFGGLVPSINALLILLATVATGRAAYGLVLVVAFGAGMAIVLGGIGLGLVYAARWMERSPRASLLGVAVRVAPAVTAAVILAIGIYLTRQAIVGAPTF
jgi:ABC-type nickel/cobalt efflux system permease component RcnA